MHDMRPACTIQVRETVHICSEQVTPVPSLEPRARPGTILDQTRLRAKVDSFYQLRANSTEEGLQFTERLKCNEQPMGPRPDMDAAGWRYAVPGRSTAARTPGGREPCTRGPAADRAPRARLECRYRLAPTSTTPTAAHARFRFGIHIHGTDLHVGTSLSSVYFDEQRFQRSASASAHPPSPHGEPPHWRMSSYMTSLPRLVESRALVETAGMARSFFL